MPLPGSGRPRREAVERVLALAHRARAAEACIEDHVACMLDYACPGTSHIYLNCYVILIVMLFILLFTAVCPFRFSLIKYVRL